MVDTEQVMTQVWHGVVDTLRQLPAVPSAPGGPSAEAESQILAAALDKLGVLMALRKGQPVAADAALLPFGSIPRLDVSTPTPAPSAGGTPGPSAGGVKRKRRMSTHSPAPPPPPHSASLDSALSSLASPLPPAHDKRGHTPTGLAVATTASAASAASAAGATGSMRGGTPMSREATGKIRKELYSDQLPLQPGRRVAFKVPLGKREEEANGETWILAMVRKCIQMDKMRYELHDADDATSIFNTTLRSIIPLPDPLAPPSHPSHPSNADVYPPNTQVLALYPDTTAFYRATVLWPPGAPGGKKDKRAGRSEDKYRLKFVDDGENEHDVDRSCVVLHPT